MKKCLQKIQYGDFFIYFLPLLVVSPFLGRPGLTQSSIFSSADLLIFDFFFTFFYIYVLVERRIFWGEIHPDDLTRRWP